MILDKTLEGRPLAVSPRAYPARSIDPHSREIKKVLERAAHDDAFIAQLTHDGERALAEYDLTMQAEAALLSGDIRWLEAHLGKLDSELCTWPQCRLQQEKW